MVFSADAADEDQYSAMRVGGSLKKTLDNIKLFRDIKEKYYSESRTITRVSGVKISNEQSIKKMENFWGNFVDQVAFVDYNPWENTYAQKPTGINTPALIFGEECSYGGMVKQIHVMLIICRNYLWVIVLTFQLRNYG